LILVGLTIRETTSTTAISAEGSRQRRRSRFRRDLDPREVFMSQVDLPRGLEREHVRERDHDYRIRGSESRTLTTAGAFRVVPAGDLRDGQDKPLDPHRGDLCHLRKSGLVQTIPAVGPGTGHSSCSPSAENNCSKQSLR
jgi:hypothetical protein